MKSNYKQLKMKDYNKLRQQKNLNNKRKKKKKRTKVKSLIDFDEEYSCSISSIATEKSKKVNLTTRFLNGKMLMFRKVSITSFLYDLIDVFMFLNQ